MSTEQHSESRGLLVHSHGLSRRQFLLNASIIAGAAVVTGCPEPCTTTCSEEGGGGGGGVNGTYVGLNPDSITQQAATQQCPMWCWAASASMIFGILGRPIAQQAIVTRAYGGLVCAPAYNSTVMGTSLSGQYVDNLGRGFRSQVTAAYDPANGIYAINNAQIIQLLSRNVPLLYGNTSHAMVVCGMRYNGSPSFPTVTQVDVIDPWPSSARVHSLSAAEMAGQHLGGAMRFLAAVAIS